MKKYFLNIEYYKMSEIIKKSEFVDKKVAMWLKDNYGKVEYRVMDDYKYDPIAMIIQYLDIIIKTKDGNVNTTYKFAKGLNFGRYYCYINNKFMGLQSLCREFRQTLCKRNYYDIDIVNCQPTILSQYCRKNNINCIELDEYVKNRETLIKELCDEYGKEKADIKDVFIKIIMGSKIPFEYQKDKTINAFYNEMVNIQIQVAKLNDKYYSYAKHRKESHYNINGSTTAYMLQDIEKSLMLSADAFFTKNGFSSDVLIYDGIQVRNDKQMTDKIMTALHKYTRDETGYEVKWAIKEMTEAYDIPQDELDNIIIEEIDVVENDTHAADKLIEKLKKTKEVIKSKGRFFLKQPNGHIYKEDKSQKIQDTNFKLINLITNENFCKEVSTKIGEIKYTPYSKNASGVNNILKVLMPKMEDDDEFNEKMWHSCLGKICFKNGYWNFKDKRFVTWDEDDKNTNQTFSPFCIKKDFPIEFNVNEKETPEEKWIMDKVIVPIFVDKVQRTFFLQWCSRCLAGDYTDKSWAVGLGNRNCGKGVLTGLFNVSFGEYCRAFNAEELVVCRMGAGDVAKKLGWLIPFEYTRLNISNELKTHDDKDRKLKLDGNAVKSVASGGDTKTARLNFKDEQQFKCQGSMFLMMNEMLEMQPADALENVVTFNFNSEFKTKLTEEDIKNNSIKNNPYKIQIADPKIKETIEQNEKYQLAFVKIILRNYIDTKPDIPEEIKELNDDLHDTSDTTIEILKESFEFTKNVNDIMTVGDVNKILNDNCKRVSKSAFKLAVNRIGIIYGKKDGGQRVYIGIKEK